MALVSQTLTPFADLADVTLADENTSSKIADNANRAIQGNGAMQVMQVKQVMQVMQDMQFIQVKQVIHIIQVIESIQRRRPFLVVPSGGQICN